MGQSDKLVIEHCIFSQTSDRYAHSTLVVHILCYLWTVVLFKVLDKLLRSTRKFCFLWESLECYKFLDQLLFCRLLLEVDEYCCCMSVQNRYTHTLACDLRKLCFHDLSVLYFTKYTKRLLLTLLFFSTNEWDNISNHFRPVFECLTCSGDCLVCCNNQFFWSELFPCCKARCIALD